MEGTCSTPSRGTAKELEKCGIDVLPVKRLHTDSTPWNVKFDVESQRITVTDGQGKCYYQATPFPPFVETPEQKNGVSNRMRILQAISRHIDAETKELTPLAAKELKRILALPNSDDSMRNISHTLIDHYSVSE